MRVLVAGIGSSHGDDAIGWQVVQRIQPQVPSSVRAVNLASPLQLLDELGEVDRLVVIDACRSGNSAGRITRVTWPTDSFERESGPSSHGFNLPSVLTLAQHLGRLPPEVILLGIEIEEFVPGAEISAATAHHLPEICEQVLRDVTAPPHGPDNSPASGPIDGWEEGHHGSSGLS